MAGCFTWNDSFLLHLKLNKWIPWQELHNFDWLALIIPCFLESKIFLCILGFCVYLWSRYLYLLMILKCFSNNLGASLSVTSVSNAIFSFEIDSKDGMDLSLLCKTTTIFSPHFSFGKLFNSRGPVYEYKRTRKSPFIASDH